MKRIKMEHSKRAFLLMRHGVKLSKKQSPKTNEKLKRMLDIPYASAVGSIQYVAQCTRPDIAYALSVTSRYQACPGEVYWTAVKTILKYLRRTKDVFLVYGGGELILEGFSDASFQSDDDDTKSQSGFVFKLNGGVVAWKSSKSSKQDTTTDSTMEAEYIAASEATKEAVWMKNYILELGVVPSIAELVVIFCDNNGAIGQLPLAISKIQSSYARDYYDPSSQRTNSRTIETGNSNHTDQDLRGFHITIPTSQFSQLTTLPTNLLKLHRRPTSPADETRLQYLVQVSVGSSMPNLEVLDLERSTPTIRSWFHSCQTYAQPNSTC
ncbi:Retrovirus-related Pol polyprotein from transposon TNT 1-94 [Sesamum angolense]|uniref:Retrovirus-related Pol polyprotein from transposon TNT 1-94 n=1 Tax=Sesamum angolense TaxID=2727404 RepID=A0AAE1WAM3_9LAMI|nr:Retrovirus-related Pol polyprotein from transposon TNT 1-94 [Sesamum angolense]